MPRRILFDQKMEERLMIRLTAEQKKQIEERAKFYGVATQVYVRTILLKAARLGWGY